MKIHFSVDGGEAPVSSCGRGRRITALVTRVDCLICRGMPMFEEALSAHKARQEAEFQAQTPRTVVPQFGRVNADGVMECSVCAGVLWRERPRDLFSYHYVCEGCGKSVHPLTETGMCT